MLVDPKIKLSMKLGNHHQLSKEIVYNNQEYRKQGVFIC